MDNYFLGPSNDELEIQGNYEDTCQREIMIEKKLPLVEIRKVDSVGKKIVRGRSIPDIPGIHNYRLIVYEGNLKKYVDIERARLIYIIVGAKEKSIQGKYIKEKRSVYISETMYIKYKKELDDFFLHQ